MAGKKIALFGSYDWGGGEWMREWEKRVSAGGATLLSGEGLIVNLSLIHICGVSFAYDEGTHVFRNIDVEIGAGRTIALVGPSGGGKTTFCSLLPRFYDVTAGSVSIDGQDVRDVTLKSLRSAIGIVQQDVYMFGGTIRDNIAYGKPGATDDEVVRAAKDANTVSYTHLDVYKRQVTDVAKFLTIINE